MRRLASGVASPSRKSEFTALPSPTYAASLTSPPETTSTIGRSNARAKAWSRSSWPGTAMIAPVP